MNRNDFQALSRLRVHEAKQLLDRQCYAGTYYLLGYAVECAIKSCIAKQTNRYDFPRKTAERDCYIHDLTKLVSTAGLWPKLQNEMKVNPSLTDNWAIVKDWNETSRYVNSVPKKQAQDFYSACTSRKHGVLSWLKKFW
jgi:hypothetical protein